LDAISEQVGDLPLVLHLAGSYLSSFEDSALGDPNNYLEELKSESLIEHPSLQGVGVDHSPTHHDLNVARTFNLSYKRLQNDSIDLAAKTLIARAAYFAPGESIAIDLLVATLVFDGSNNLLERQIEMESAINRLTNLGLVERGAGRSLKLHRLIAEFIKSEYRDSKAQSDVEAVFLRIASKYGAFKTVTSFPEGQTHLKYITDTALIRNDENSADLAMFLGQYLYFLGPYQLSEFYFRRALQTRQSIFGTGHIAVAEVLDALAHSLRLQQKSGEAKLLFETAFSVIENQLPEGHHAIAKVLNGLALSLKEMGQYQKALSLSERILAYRQSSSTPSQQDISESHNNIAGIYKDLMNSEFKKAYTEAEKKNMNAVKTHLERAKMFFNHSELHLEKALRSAMTGTTLHNLAGLYQDVGVYDRRFYDKAKPLFKEALAIREEMLGEHPETAQTLNNFGVLLKDQGNKEEAKPLLQRAFVFYEKLYGIDHLTTQLAKQNLDTL
jgi:tetratricopeptide (TPR) repeat protein